MPRNIDISPGGEGGKEKVIPYPSRERESIPREKKFPRSNKATKRNRRRKKSGLISYRGGVGVGGRLSGGGGGWKWL